MSVLTKVAIKNNVEFYIFNEGQEKDYLLSLCSYCHSEECNEDCIVTVPGAVACDSCDGAGLIKFYMRNPSDGGESYFVITQCGYCNGIGLV